MKIEPLYTYLYSLFIGGIWVLFQLGLDPLIYIGLGLLIVMKEGFPLSIKFQETLLELERAWWA